MRGPEGSDYEGATLELSVVFSSSYPARAPECRFVTPIIHMNVNSNGKICHTLLDANWSPSFTMLDVLTNLHDLLGHPEYTSPIDSVLGELYRVNIARYREKAKNSVASSRLLSFA